MLPLAPSTNSALIGLLFRQRPDHAFLRNASVPRAPPVASGTLSATALAWNPTSSLPTPSRCSKSSHNDYGRVAPLPAVDPCGLGTWRISSAVWGRRMPGWLGSADPRLNPHGQIDFRLTSLYQSWAKADPPPSRVKPLPMTLLRQVVALAHRPRKLRPSSDRGTPPHAWCFLPPGATGRVHWQARQRNGQPLSHPGYRPKNGVLGEKIGHGRSGDPKLCPVLCVVELLVALRALHAPPSTPINAYCPTRPSNPFRYVLPADLTRRIRATLAVYPDASYHPRDVSARSTRAGGAMALLCAGVDRDHIRMIGRWRSDELFRYLHVQAQPIMNGLSAAMLHGGTFRLDPG
ncbi:hypothetical protein MHU86_13053 [Fragilaria crotonensis]|nr:hypothetical protein MHU86_13053 [Fragilaria crotonensis]